MVDRAIGEERDPVVALGDVAADQPVGDIGGDLLCVALGWVAKAAAARQFEPGEIAARHGLPPLRADRLAGDQRHPAGRAHAAAVAAARRVVDALEIAQERDRRAVGAAQLDDLAEPAAEAARPTRALAELAAAEHDRRYRFGGLDRDRAHPRGERGNVEPVLARPRTGPAAMKDDRAERRPVSAIWAGAELVFD